MYFLNRNTAGEMLAEELASYKNDVKNVVYALPRGGVILWSVVAKALWAPLDLIIPRKIGHPYNPEYAVCAVTENGPIICDESEKKYLDSMWLDHEVNKQRQEAKRRRERYLQWRDHIVATGKRAILVDDGVATGLTMRAALSALKKEHPAEIIVAVPVCPSDVLAMLEREARVVVLDDAKDFLGSIGAYYGSFPQVGDEEVISILSKKS